MLFWKWNTDLYYCKNFHSFPIDPLSPAGGKVISEKFSLDLVGTMGLEKEVWWFVYIIKCSFSHYNTNAILQKKYWVKLNAPQKIAIMDILLSLLEFSATYNSYNNLRQRMNHIPDER